MANKHHAHVINSLEEYLEYCSTVIDRSTGLKFPMEEGKYQDKAIRKAKARWKKHVEKHGNVPMVLKCSICSGQEQKENIKHGRYHSSRPTKGERDELKDTE